MSVFTKAGINFLKALRTEIAALSAKVADLPAEKKESAESENEAKPIHRVLAAADWILENLIDHNGWRYWNKDANQQALMSQLAVLGCDAGNYVPDVFDTVTYQFGKILLAALGNFDYAKYVSFEVEKIVNLFVDVPKLVAQIRARMHFQLRVHEKLVAQNNSTTELYNLYREGFIAEIECALAELKVTPESKADSPGLQQQLEKFKQKYTAGAQLLVGKLTEIPYVRYLDGSNSMLLPAEAKAKHSFVQMKMEEYRLVRIKELLEFEKLVNEGLKAVNCKLTYFYDHFRKTHVNAKSQEFSAKIAGMMTATRANLGVFKEGNKFALFGKQAASNNFVTKLCIHLDVHFPPEAKLPEAQVAGRCHSVYSVMAVTALEMREHVRYVSLFNDKMPKEPRYKELLLCADLLEKRVDELMGHLLDLNESNDMGLMLALAEVDGSLKLQAGQSAVACVPGR